MSPGDGAARRNGPETPWRPTREQLAAARGATVPDLLRPGLDVVFVGINPGLYSGAVRHHFARPGNRFWAALHGAGFTPRPLGPFEERELLALGIGITNLVDRATAGAEELTPTELREGAARVAGKLEAFAPRHAAFLGVSAYRTAFGRARATVGEQPGAIGSARVWVLPNPSGRAAGYQLPDLVEAFAALRDAVAGR